MSMPSAVSVRALTFTWPNGQTLFTGLETAFNPGKTGLIGNNGSGKSTLLRLISDLEKPTSGHIETTGHLAYLPQELPLQGEATVAELLGVTAQVSALTAIENGDASPHHFDTIGDQWDVVERSRAHLDALGLTGVQLHRTVDSLSGGEAMLTGLAGKLLTRPDILILDEPTNNLDASARSRLYAAIDRFDGTLIVVSHDRTLLEHVDYIAEMREEKIRTFSGTFSDYSAAIDTEQRVAERRIRDARGEVQRQKREKIENQTKIARRQQLGRKFFDNKREPRIVMNQKKRNAQVSAAKLNAQHDESLSEAKESLSDAKDSLRNDASISVDLPETAVPNGRTLVRIRQLNYGHLFGDLGIDLAMEGPERLALVGDNGSGKTTLLRLIAGQLQPDTGEVISQVPVRYLPQRLEVLDPEKTIFDNVKVASATATDTQVRNRLARFQFRKNTVYQTVESLSGGEKLRAALARVLFASPAPQLLMLDEPTNNLDMSSVEQLRSALANYRGGLIVASHDRSFLADLGITRWLSLSKGEPARELSQMPDVSAQR